MSERRSIGCAIILGIGFMVAVSQCSPKDRKAAEVTTAPDTSLFGDGKIRTTVETIQASSYEAK